MLIARVFEKKRGLNTLVCANVLHVNDFPLLFFDEYSVNELTLASFDFVVCCFKTVPRVEFQLGGQNNQRNEDISDSVNGLFFFVLCDG